MGFSGGEISEIAILVEKIVFIQMRETHFDQKHTV